MKKLKIEEIPNFVLQQISDCGLVNNTFKIASQRYTKNSIETGGAYGCVDIGCLFCRMIEKFTAKYLSGKVFFLNNLVDYVESRPRRGDTVVLLSDCDNLPNDNIINFGHFFRIAPEWVKNEIITRMIVQLETKEIILPNKENLEFWVLNHEMFLRENKIKVSYMI